MKDYHEVVNTRYNNESGNSNSIYAKDKPIGIYTRSRIFPCLRELLKNNVSAVQDYSGKKLLDVGCGNGEMVAFFLECGFKPENSTGIDLSEKRIADAEKSVKGVKFVVENGLKFKLEAPFDLITSFDMFSHIITEEEIVEGLKNIKDHLSDNGVFLWYDIYSDDHYTSPENSDSWGFSTDQMIELGKKAGLVVVDKKNLFKNIFGKYNSVYQARRFSFWLIRMMEKTLPGTPGNVAMVFRKA